MAMLTAPAEGAALEPERFNFTVHVYQRHDAMAPPSSAVHRNTSTTFTTGSLDVNADIVSEHA